MRMREGRVVSKETKAWPHHELGAELSNWGRWGDDDEIGTLNFVTPEVRVRAASLVRTGKSIDLGMPFDKNGPFLPGGFRHNPIHVMTHLPWDVYNSPDGMISSDDMIIMGLQAATQWDSLAHVGYNGVFYNNVPMHAVNNFVGASRNSFAKAVGHLISRGVLLDIARLKGVDALDLTYEVTPGDLEAAEERQGVRVESGDILCIRTGAYSWFLAGDRQRYMGDEPGPGMDCCRWLYEREVAALALDNHACEVRPSPLGLINPFHEVTIRDIGLTLGEMFNFEDLAVDCEQDGVWEFLMSATGLKVTGSVGSPLTPMALK
jgi:kynurenine formamidase